MNIIIDIVKAEKAFAKFARYQETEENKPMFQVKKRYFWSCDVL